MMPKYLAVCTSTADWRGGNEIILHLNQNSIVVQIHYCASVMGAEFAISLYHSEHVQKYFLYKYVCLAVGNVVALELLVACWHILDWRYYDCALIIIITTAATSLLLMLLLDDQEIVEFHYGVHNERLHLNCSKFTI